MTFDEIKEMQIGSKKVKEAWLNGRQVYPSEKRIMDSLVCWYDIGKQQCTNESMAANPTLRDLSGNGHDATCYNFAWSEMSGIGGYEENFNNYKQHHDRADYSISHDGSTIHIDSIIIANVTYTTVLEKFSINTFNINEFKIKVTGLSTLDENSSFIVDSISNNITTKIIETKKDGIYNIPNLQDITYFRISIGKSIVQNLDITIEQLPLYPNALVSDGVDDYAKVTGLPILTKEKGYTVIAKRDNLYQLNEKGIVASKHSGRSDGAFQIEYNFDNVRATAWNFGSSNIIQFSSSKIIYQTSKSYNGETSLNIGTFDDTSILDLFKYINQVWGKVALYSFLLFNRDLTDAEIEWVKENMVEADGVMMYDWMDKDLFINFIEDGSRATGSINSDKMVITGIVNPYARFFETKGTNDKVINSYKIKVTGVTDNVHVRYSGKVNGTETILLEISQDGIYTLPQVEGRTIGFRPYIVNNDVDTPVNITIQQLITPLDQPLDHSLIDAWIFSGLRNEDAPASIVGEKGIELSCSNFAWNEQGSGFKDGALYFDGVDDYCVRGNVLTCDRNVTVIGKRKLTTDEYNQWQCSLNIHVGSDYIPIIYLDYYESSFESAYGYKMKSIFGDYELYYNNDTDPHTFWATKDLFNGEKYVNKATNLEDGKKYNYNIYLGRVWSGIKSACAWYYLAVYDKVMTEQEAQFEIEKLEKIWSNRLNNNKS